MFQFREIKSGIPANFLDHLKKLCFAFSSAALFMFLLKQWASCHKHNIKIFDLAKYVLLEGTLYFIYICECTASDDNTTEHGSQVVSNLASY